MKVTAPPLLLLLAGKNGLQYVLIAVHAVRFPHHVCVALPHQSVWSVALCCPELYGSLGK